MGFFSSRNKQKNPQSGASLSSSSGGQESGTHGSAESSDINVPTVNLTEQRLQDWKAGSIFNNSSDNPNPYAAPSSVMNNGPPRNNNTISNTFTPAAAPTTSSSSSSSSSPNQLILLIERGQWNAATQRATTHEHEVRQLVKLRKTTKNNPSSSSSSATAADGSSASSASSPTKSPTAGGSSSKRNVQISNVKCKALHHACQKLRSVHTTIYQKHSFDSSSSTSATTNNNNNTRRVIDEDEYISACKTILTLIKIHPTACKERESRHGCLPLHLCVFSMCNTPPPPMSSVLTQGNGGSKKGHKRNSSHGISNTKRPPINSSRSTSAPLNLPAIQTTNSKEYSGVNKTHRKTPSNDGSTDFSLGNISQMIMEETEHQQALTAHQDNQKIVSSKGASSSPGSTGSSGIVNNIEEQIYKGMESMEKLLIGLENKYEMKDKDKKKKKKGVISLPSQTTTTTTVVNAMTPMDAVEERSRETDSHSTPQVLGVAPGAPPRTGAEGLPSSFINKSVVSITDDDESSKMAASTSSGTTVNLSNTTTTTSSALPTTSYSSSQQQLHHQPTYEDLQRRYIQINTQQREKYSIRVINALLDAWPKSVKTSSEGGRLPLHMACFGKATVKVMETILTAYPDAARQRNHDGFLPIHIAAHWGVSHPDIAPLILRAYPDGAVGRNRWERTPIEEALGMAGENGRPHQLSLVWSLRRHPTYWIHNDIGMMLLPRNVRLAPWRMVDVGDYNPNSNNTGGQRSLQRLGETGGGGGAVDVDEVGSSDASDEGVEVQVAKSSSSPSTPNIHDPVYIRALAESTELSLLITKDKHWKAAALRCRSHPQEACEAMEVKVRGAYTAKITPLHYACENKPSTEVIKTLIKANSAALERRQEPGGQLPLHAACTWGASSDVIKTLLAAHPSSAEMKDFLSNLPLHCACYSGAATVVIEALLRVYPQSVWPRNHQGSSAVDIVRRLGHGNRKEVLRVLERTQSRLLERAAAGGEGVEVDNDNSLEWV